MRLAIMQPYFFPYIGYWQLINTVETFVIYDDVNFIKQSYINRNSILTNGKAQGFTLELIGASSNKMINKIEVGNNTIKILKTIRQNYIKAPYYKEIIPIIEEILIQDEKNLAYFIGFSLQKIASFLNMNTTFLYSSQIEKNSELRAQDKVIDICKKLHAHRYINAIGGQALYDKDVFRKNDLELSFIKTNLLEYKQFQNDFVPYLSIIDILMFNSKEEIMQMLMRYELV